MIRERNNLPQNNEIVPWKSITFESDKTVTLMERKLRIRDQMSPSTRHHYFPVPYIYFVHLQKSQGGRNLPLHDTRREETEVIGRGLTYALHVTHGDVSLIS